MFLQIFWFRVAQDIQPRGGRPPKFFLLGYRAILFRLDDSGGCLKIFVKKPINSTKKFPKNFPKNSKFFRKPLDFGENPLKTQKNIPSVTKLGGYLPVCHLKIQGRGLAEHIFRGWFCFIPPCSTLFWPIFLFIKILKLILSLKNDINLMFKFIAFSQIIE